MEGKSKHSYQVHNKEWYKQSISINVCDLKAWGRLIIAGTAHSVVGTLRFILWYLTAQEGLVQEI